MFMWNNINPWVIMRRLTEILKQDSEDEIIPIHIILNNRQHEKGYEVNGERVIYNEKNPEVKEQTKNPKVIRKESPIINSDAVNHGKPATTGDGKMRNSYSKHIVQEKESNKTDGKDEGKNTDFEQKENADMLDKIPANVHLVISFS